MRFVRLLLVFGLFGGTLFANGARVQADLDVSKNPGGCGGATCVMTAFTSSITSTDLIAAVIGWGLTDGTPSASGSLNGAYTTNGKVWDASNAQGQAQFYFQNSAAGTETITFTIPNTANSVVMWGMEISGVLTVGAADGNGITNTDSTSPYISPAVVTTATDFLTGWYQDISGTAFGTVSGSNGYTLTAGDSVDPIAVDWKTNIGAASNTADIAVTTNHRSFMGIMAFKQSAAASGCPKTLTLLGAGC